MERAPRALKALGVPGAPRRAGPGARAPGGHCGRPAGAGAGEAVAARRGPLRAAAQLGPPGLPL
eukprot:7399632-Lingulodinium_polyedra.AAC.1